MKSRSVLFLNVLWLAMYALANPQVLRADKLELKDGTRVEGIIKKVEKGQVTVEVGQETKAYSILEVTSMDFDTPHVPEGVSQRSLEHFVTNTEAQEIVIHVQDVDKAAKGIRQLIDQAKEEWGGGKTIPNTDTPKWEATKERFDRALSRYQEVLDDFYFHVLARVDEYGRLTKEAGGVRVGVKGAFHVGSSLVSKEMEELPLRGYVPSNWYDTIFYKGYSLGYNDAYWSRPMPDALR